jgi:hypothetical protein
MIHVEMKEYSIQKWNEVMMVDDMVSMYAYQDYS